ncbi:hypothetical protein IQ07DRAFT_128685 [Pyrenochaeta sp. DS3sAY3a]|nr:hypothetical protein IQ07DRAFT_128685 [Pyrenochaeta sp. DS3sAY3a]
MLQQPIAIPAASEQLGSPFLRAYPLELENLDLPAPIFLKFLDDLNRHIVVSPGLQVVNTTGDILGLAPLAEAQIVGTALNVAAEAASYGVSKSRGEMFLRQANKDLFTPRGLRVAIVRLEALALAAKIPILADDGTVRKDVSLLPPIPYDSDTNSDGDSEAQEEVSAQSRRLAALALWTSPLQIHAPLSKADLPTNKISAFHASVSEKQRIKEEEAALKKRTKARSAAQKRQHKASASLDKELERLQHEQDKLREKEGGDAAKLEKARLRIEEKKEKRRREHEGVVEKIRREVVRKDGEERAMREMGFLMVVREEEYVGLVERSVRKIRAVAATV